MNTNNSSNDESLELFIENRQKENADGYTPTATDNALFLVLATITFLSWL